MSRRQSSSLTGVDRSLQQQQQQQSQPLPAPKLHQKSLFVIPDSRGILGASLRHEAVLENQKLRQQFRHIQHDYYQQELPFAVSREKEIAADALKKKMDVMKKFSSFKGENDNNHYDFDDGDGEDEYESKNHVFLNRTSNATALPSLRGDKDHDDSRLLSVNLSRSASPIMGGKNGEAEHQFLRNTNSLTPSHLHRSSNYPARLSPFPNNQQKISRNTPTPTSTNNNTNNLKTKTQSLLQNQKLNNSNVSRSSHSLSLSTSQQYPHQQHQNQSNFFVSAKEEEEARKLAAAAGVSRGASNALVKQLDLLRLRCPTPTMSDDVADAFQSYRNGNNKNSSHSPSSSVTFINAQNNIRSDPESGFQFTKCVVASTSPLVASAVQHCSHVREDRMRGGLNDNSFSSNDYSPQKQNHSNHRGMQHLDTRIHLSPTRKSSSSSRHGPEIAEDETQSSAAEAAANRPMMIQRVVDVNTSLHMRTTTTSDGRHKIYSSVDQRMDACEDNGELCGRLRKDIIAALGTGMQQHAVRGSNPVPLKFVQF